MKYFLTTFFNRSHLCVTVSLLFLFNAGCITVADENASSAGNVGGSSSEQGNSSLSLSNAYWGRLVDIFDVNGILIEADVVIREDVVNDDDYTFTLNPITQKEVLTISHAEGTVDFELAIDSAKSGLPTLQEKGAEDPAPFTKVARNGAIRLEFTELVAPSTVNRQTVQILEGAADSSFRNLEVKYITKEEVGLDGEPMGVIIIDPTVSKYDSENSVSGITENGVGFPSSVNATDPNLKLYIPTTVNVFANQTMVLQNKALTQNFGVQRNSVGNIIEPHEFIGLDPVSVRVVRTGNSADLYNGFLLDILSPDLISEQSVSILSVVEIGPSVRTITFTNNVVNCRGVTPKISDVFEVPDLINGDDAVLQVTQLDDTADSNGYVVTAALIEGSLNASSVAQDAVLTTRYTFEDYDYQLCFVKFSPAPTELPATGVLPSATVTVTFSEAMDISSVRSLDSMVLASANLAANPGDEDSEWLFGTTENVGDYIDRLPGFGSGGGSGRIMFGPIQPSGDAQSFTLAPVAGITDGFGEGGLIHLSLALRDGNSGILDLAGNPVGFTDFVAGHTTQNAVTPRITLNGNADDIKYFALRGNGIDENNDQMAEYSGQLGTIEGDGVLRGRPVIRYSRQADRTNTYVGQRIAFTQGLMTPLVPSGAVTMSLFGYHHLGFGLNNSNEYNVDIEGMSWSPFNGIVYDTTFQRYSVALAHSNRFPDDWIDPGDGYPEYKNSGLKRRTGSTSPLFDKNIYGFGDDPVKYADLDEKIVFDVPTYTISQVNVYKTPGGVDMYPWPEFTDTYTYRDTSFPLPDGQNLLGGNINDGWGVPPRVVTENKVYDRGTIPSIGLPLLMRMRCYVVGGEYGYNGSQVQIMVGSSSIPAFRVFSMGGVQNGIWDYVVPDLDGAGTAPEGGTGVGNLAHGPELYWGQVDFVTRVSRVFTHWFDAGAPVDFFSSFTLEPTPAQANPGTSVEVQFRTSPAISVAGCVNETSPLEDAASIFDAYGEYDNSLGCGNVSLPTEWTSDPSELTLNPSQYFQLRFTFIANIDQNLPAELDAFGFAYTTF